MNFKFIALMAAFLTSTGFVPQIIKSFRIREIKDVSMVTLLFSSIGTFLWAIYGIYLKDIIIIGANFFTCFTVCVLIVMKFIYKQE